MNRFWSNDSALEENTEAEIVLIETISIIAKLNIFVKKVNLLTERIFNNRLFWLSTVKFKSKIIKLSD